MVASIISPPCTAKPLSADDFAGDMIPSKHALFGIVWLNPERLSGAPCFTGTCVPVDGLFDHLEVGDTLDLFLDDFPGVTRKQAIGLLDFCKSRGLDRYPA